jgi:hypothetical protein
MILVFIIFILPICLGGILMSFTIIQEIIPYNSRYNLKK